MAVNRSWWFLSFWALAALCSCGHDWESLEEPAHAPGVEGTGGSGPDSGASAGGEAGQGISGQGGAEQGGAEQGGAAHGGAGQGGQGNTGTGGAAEEGGSSGSSAGGSLAGQGGQAATGGSSGAAGQGECACSANEQCREGLCVGAAVQLSVGYEIDRTEVTRSQYAAWLASLPAVSSQSSVCSWNDSFAPPASCMADSKVCQGDVCGDQPQVCVDWCDAAAYCKAVGKRLCGGVGGGETAWSAFDSASQSQWMGACSSNGAHKYPYGGGYLGALCNGPDHAQTGCSKGACTTQKVGALAGCQSPDTGFLGAIDLSGNAAEWEDSCSAQSGAADLCRVRGGSFASLDGKLELRCNAADSLTRNAADPTVGFRCCSL